MSHSVSPLRTRCVRDVTVESWLKAKVGAIKAPTIAIATRLERKIVILVIQRSRKVLEVVAGRASRALRAFWGAAASDSGASLGVAAAAAAAQHEQLTHVDLGAVPGLAFLVRPLPVLDPSFDVDLVALLDVFLYDVGKLRSLRIPDDAAVPFGFFLLLTRRAAPRPARGKRKGRDTIPACSRSNLGVGPEISDQGHLVQASAHDSSWRV